MIAVATTPAFADSPASRNLIPGDRYAITTMSGEARAWVHGSWVTSPADLQLMVEVTYASQHNVVFKVLSGTIQFNGKVYSIVRSAWRGDYNRDTHTCVYQGPAIAPNGERAFFVIYGQDTVPTQQGTYMHMWSAFRDEDMILWKMNLQTYRFKINYRTPDPLSFWSPHPLCVLLPGVRHPFPTFLSYHLIRCLDDALAPHYPVWILRLECPAHPLLQHVASP